MSCSHSLIRIGLIGVALILASCGGSDGHDEAAVNTDLRRLGVTGNTYTHTFDARNYIESGSKDVIGHYYTIGVWPDYDCVYTFEATLKRVNNIEIYFESFTVVEANHLIYEGGSAGVHIAESSSQYDSADPLLTGSAVSDSNHLTFYRYSGTTPLSDIPMVDRSANLSLEFSDDAKMSDACIKDMHVSLQAVGLSSISTLYGGDGNGMFVLIYDKSDWEQYASDAVKQADIFADTFPGWAGFRSYFSFGSKPTTDYDGTAATLDLAFDAHDYANPNFNWTPDSLERYGQAYDLTVRDIADGSSLSTGWSKLISTNDSTQNVFLVGGEAPAAGMYSDACNTQYGEDQICDTWIDLIFIMHGAKDRAFAFRDWDFSYAYFLIKQ